MFDLRSIVIGMVLMLRKYTCIDINIYAETTDEDYKNGILVLPLIGFAIGCIACIISWLKNFYDSFFVSVLILTYYIIITKSVNMKESYRTLNYYIKPKNQSEQLSGLIGIMLINLMYFSLFRIVPQTALIVMSTAGYSSPAILNTVIKRNKDNTSIMKHCDNVHSITAFVFSFLIAALFNYRLVIPLSLTYILLGMIVSMLEDKVELLPSSIEGAFIEITQVMFLLITYLLKI